MDENTEQDLKNAADKNAADDRRKHLDYIQAVITRLAGNSFSIKTWAVGLIGVLGGLVVKTPDFTLALALLFPVIGFWYLDAYYLRQERLFRALYKAAIDPSRANKVRVFDMNPTSFADPKDHSMWTVAMSETVKGLHGTILLLVLALAWYSWRLESKTPQAALAPSSAEQSATNTP